MSVTLEQILAVLRYEGLDTGSDIHSWRCYNPDYFPDYCDCPEHMAAAIFALIKENE